MARPREISMGDRARICARWLTGETGKVLAKEYGCAVGTIRNITAEAGLTADMKIGASSASDPKRLKKMIEDYGSIPEPDWADPLDVQSYLYTMASKAAARCMTDPNYPGSESARLRDFQKHAASAQKLLPAAQMHRVRKMIEEDARAMEDGAGPQMVPVQPRTRRHRPKKVISEAAGGATTRPVAGPRKTRGAHSAPTRKDS